MAKLVAVFMTVFLAELGDKTQLATLLYATDRRLAPVLVFGAASLALVASTALAVVAGNMAGEYLRGLPLKLIAGLGFVGIGLWSILDHFLKG